MSQFSSIKFLARVSFPRGEFTDDNDEDDDDEDTETYCVSSSLRRSPGLHENVDLLPPKARV